MYVVVGMKIQEVVDKPRSVPSSESNRDVACGDKLVIMSFSCSASDSGSGATSVKGLLMESNVDLPHSPVLRKPGQYARSASDHVEEICWHTRHSAGTAAVMPGAS